MSKKETYFNPFPGLRAFEEDEEYLFFGREKQTDDLIGSLRKSRFLAVIGASGSGKSSLVKSGLLPALHSGMMSGISGAWNIIQMRPGTEPIKRLAEAFCNSENLIPAEITKKTFESITESTLVRSKTGIIDAVADSGMKKNDNILILVDQFEEIFRFRQLEKEQQKTNSEAIHFIDLLLTAAQSNSNIFIAITMRSDFLADCTRFHGLPESINKGQYLIPRMTRDEIKLAITGPVAVGGAKISNQLVSTLLNEIGDNPDQLPILQHALMRTWDYWYHNSQKGEPLDIQHYTAIGTMSSALSMHAEEAFSELATDQAKQKCERIFKLITEGGESKGIRRPQSLFAISKYAQIDINEAIEIINVFRKEQRSFLMPPPSVELEENTVIDISHESLMRIWDRLIKWVNEEAESAEMYLRLSEAAALHEEGETGLWRNPELQIGLNWREKHHPTLEWSLRYDKYFHRAINFLEESNKAHLAYILLKENEQKKRLKKAKRRALYAGIFAFFALLLMIFALFQRQIAEQEKRKAFKAKIKAEEKTREVILTRDSLKTTFDELEKGKKRLEATYATLIAQKRLVDSQNNILKVQEERMRKDSITLRNSFEQLKKTKSLLEIEQTNLRASNKKNLELLNINIQNYLLSLSRYISNKAIKLNYEEKLDSAAQIAVYAHYLNRTHGGPIQNADNYNALLAIQKSYAKQNARKGIASKEEFNFHRFAVRAVSVNPIIPTEVATADDNGKVYVWNVNSPNTIIKEFTVKDAVTSVNYSSCAQYLTVSTVSGTVKIYEIKNNYKEISTKLLNLLIRSAVKDFRIFERDEVKYAMLTTLEDVLFFKFTEHVLTPIFSISEAQINCCYLNDHTLYLSTTLAVLQYHLSFEKNNYYSKFERMIKFESPISTIYSFAGYAALGNEKGAIWVVPQTVLNNVKEEADLIAYKRTEHTAKITSIQYNASYGLLASSSLDKSVNIWLHKPTETAGSSSTYKEDKFSIIHNSSVFNAVFINNTVPVLLSTARSPRIQLWHITSENLINELTQILNANIKDPNRTWHKHKSVWTLSEKEWLRLVGAENQDIKEIPIPIIPNQQ